MTTSPASFGYIGQNLPGLGITAIHPYSALNK